MLKYATVANIDDPQLNIGIFWTRRWISYRSCFWKWCAPEIMHSHKITGIKPWIHHCTDISIIERYIHNMWSIVWAPNRFRCCENFLCTSIFANNQKNQEKRQNKFIYQKKLEKKHQMPTDFQWTMQLMSEAIVRLRIVYVLFTKLYNLHDFSCYFVVVLRKHVFA